MRARTPFISGLESLSVDEPEDPYARGFLVRAPDAHGVPVMK